MRSKRGVSSTVTELPRTLRDYWDGASPSAMPVWRGFIIKWLARHGKAWDLAERHWLQYVDDFVGYEEFEHLSDAPLLRKAEGAAQQFLARQMAARARCTYCETMGGRPRGSKR